MYTMRRVYAVGMADIMHIGTKDLRNEIGRRVDAAHFLGEPTIITKNNEPRAVLVSYAWYEQQTKGTG